jgi:hypothetical protein
MDQAIQELTEYGLIGTGFTRGEVGWLPEAVGGKVGAMQGKVQTVANVIEDMGRGACYLAGRAKGWAPEEAAAETFKMFYSYGSDFGGPADRAMSQVVFFWRWVRQNLVGSGRNFAEHYGKHTALAKGIKAIEDRAGLGGEEYQPEWMKERGAIKLRRGKRGIEMFTLQNWLPFADIAQIPRLHKYAGESLIPPLRILGEIMTGREWYYDRPIVDPSGIPGQWAGMSMNPRLAYALRQFRPISEPGRIVGQALREPPGKGRIGRALWTWLAGAKTYPYRPEKEAGSRFFETIPKIATVKSQMTRIERETPDQQRKHRKLYQNLGKLLEKLREEEARYATGAGIR